MPFYYFATIMLLCFQSLAFSEKDISFIASDGLEIGGTLSLPENLSKHTRPALLFLHGSGPLDRDLRIPGKLTANGKPSYIFKNMAQRLSKEGFISYRFDKRGVTKAVQGGAPIIDQDIYATADVDQLVIDALSALSVLRNHPNVNPEKILLIGLSEGTILAPLVAKKADISGLILLSAAGQNLKDLLYFQQVQRNIDWAREKIDLNEDGYLVQEEVDQFPATNFPLELMDLDKDSRVSLAELKALLVAQHYNSLELMLKSPSKDWYQQHFELTPNYKTLASFEGPILLMQGEIDAQTPLSDALLIKSHLQASGHTALSFISFPNLGHGFSPHIGKNKIIPTVGPMEPYVLEPLVDWMQENF